MVSWNYSPHDSNAQLNPKEPWNRSSNFTFVRNRMVTRITGLQLNNDMKCINRTTWVSAELSKGEKCCVVQCRLASNAAIRLFHPHAPEIRYGTLWHHSIEIRHFQVLKEALERASSGLSNWSSWAMKLCKFILWIEQQFIANIFYFSACPFCVEILGDIKMAALSDPILQRALITALSICDPYHPFVVIVSFSVRWFWIES